jgi:hypothetical protein
MRRRNVKTDSRNTTLKYLWEYWMMDSYDKCQAVFLKFTPFFDEIYGTALSLVHDYAVVVLSPANPPFLYSDNWLYHLFGFKPAFIICG